MIHHNVFDITPECVDSKYKSLFLSLKDAPMHRLLAAGLVSAGLMGCAGNSASIPSTTVSSQLADGVDLVILYLPAMT